MLSNILWLSLTSLMTAIIILIMSWQVSVTKWMQRKLWWGAVICPVQVVLCKRWCWRRCWCLWGGLWFSVSVGEMRIGIQRGTGRAVSGETGGRGSPHPGTQGESHLTAHVTHAHTRTHNGSHWWRIISSNQYQFMSFKTKVPISSPTQILFRVHFVGWSNVKMVKNEQSST